MSSVALVCSEPLKDCMAGIAIRYTELAAALALEDFDVHLYAPAIDGNYSVPNRVKVHALTLNSVTEQLDHADAVVVQGHLGESIVAALPDTPIAVDLYDPYLIENISYAEQLGAEVFCNDLRNWVRLCERGDFFLCASEQQRLFYCGFLLAHNRISPQRLADDVDLRQLIDVVPFGVPEQLPPHQPWLPAARPGSFRILFGGLYDWYDPFTLLEALDTEDCNHCELILVRNPNPDTTPQKLIAEVEDWARERNWHNDRLTIIDWVPYVRRYDLLRDVDLMVATHADTFETSLSLRTRFLDAIAAECPIITNAGGAIADIVLKYEAGTVTQPGQVEELRAAILDNMRRADGDMNKPNGRSEFLSDFSWQRVIAPLVEFCANPRLQSDHSVSLHSTAKQRPAKIRLFSILLPTYNRMDILPEVLESLEAQWDAPPFEIVIVNDGSTDGTKEWLEQREFSVPVTVIHQDNAGPASARNRAIESATGDYLVLLGDDTVPNRYWLQAHYDAHQKRDFDDNLIVVGQIDWHERMQQTPFIRFVDETGWQFAFDKIEDPENLSFNYFYGSNLSLPSHQLESERFNTSFPYPAWEDSELGYRLQCNGCRFVFEQAARTAHLHKTTIARFAERQRKAGYCAMVFNRLHPEIGALVWPNAESLNNASGKAIAAGRKRLAAMLEPLPVAMPTLWNKVLRDHYVDGIRRYLNDHNIEYAALSRQQIFPIVYAARSPVLHHHTGHLEQQNWICRLGEHEPGHCVFGPNYRVTEDAAMSVKFYLSCESLQEDSCEAVTLDVYDNSNDVVLAEQVLYSDQIHEHPEPELDFAATTGQQLEFRIFWHGRCSIAVAKIELSRHSHDH